MNHLPATPEALHDPDYSQEIRQPVHALAGELASNTASEAEPALVPNPEGLQINWSKGEQIPWKGIWFEVAEVEPESITLRPVGTTWKRFKQLKANGRK